MEGAWHSDRRASPRKLPSYSYVPGKGFPHPIRDPGGHSHGEPEPAAAIRDPAEWDRCDEFLWGLDLFNHGFYWEAHESWEAVWRAAEPGGLIADFTKALIKLAAACVKAREGRANGVRRHAARAGQLLRSVAERLEAGRQPFMGLPVDELIQRADSLQSDPEAILDTADEPVVVVAPFVLEARPQ